MKTFKTILFVMLISLTFVSCTKHESSTPPKGILKAGTWTWTLTPASFDLMAGQNIYIGTVFFELMGPDPGTGDLKVTYALVNGWTMDQIHFWIGTDPNGYPQVKKGSGKGSPIPGQFPYKFENLGWITTKSFIVPNSAVNTVWCGGTFYFIAHTAVRFGDEINGYQYETAWTEGTELPGSNWAMESFFAVSCNYEEGGEDQVCDQWDQTETAYCGNAVGTDNKPWFYYLDVSDPNLQYVTAGQHITIGTISYSAGVITISLINGWELQDVAESVKIKGYPTIPESRPPSGDFPWKGTSLVVNVDPYPFYIVHLDVRHCSHYTTIP